MIAGPWFDVVGIKWLPHSLLLMLVVLLAVTFLLPHREVHDLSPEPALLRNILKKNGFASFLGRRF